MGDTTVSRSVLLAIPLLLVSFAVGHADELTSEEQSWLETCVRRLDADSEHVAQGAAEALKAFGIGGVPGMVAATRDLERGHGWRLFEQVLRSFGGGSAAAALEETRARWPERARSRLAELQERLESPQSGEIAPGVVPLIERELAPLRSATSYSSQDPRVMRVAALGRKAVPALVEILRRSTGSHGGFYFTGAADALTRLVERGDLPILAELLEDGILLAAKCFTGLSGPSARDALLVPVGKGFMSHDLKEALGPFVEDAKTHKVLREYLESAGHRGGQETGWVAELCAQGGDFDAVPLLRRLLPKVHDLAARESIAEALVDLGEKDAIPELIAIVAEGLGRDFDVWHCQAAGRKLNTIVGRRVFAGTSGPFTLDKGNFAEAADEFRAWWVEHQESLVYDKRYRRWKTKR